MFLSLKLIDFVNYTTLLTILYTRTGVQYSIHAKAAMLIICQDLEYYPTRIWKKYCINNYKNAQINN